ncbi:MAG TPA: phosphotransferase [Thermoanaerobaculia bacterium]|nr:phosphotransferase [Thermoanaerobaculia bacterium]
MRVLESGRITLPPGAVQARRFASRNLLTVHRRRERIAAAILPPPLRGTVRELDAELADLALDRSIGEELRIALESWTRRAGEWLLLRDYDASARRRSTLFLFESGHEQPFVVVKFRPAGAAGADLEAELRILGSIRPRLTDPIRDAVPSPLDFARSAEGELLFLSFLPGRPLAISMQRSIRPYRAHLEHLASAGAWLGGFHRGTAERTLSGRADDRAAVHGDFWPRNLLFAASGSLTGIVDWEHARPYGPTFRDLFTLLFLFAMARGSQRTGPARFRRAFIDSAPPAAAVQRCLRAYCRAASIDYARLRDLFEHFLTDSEDLAGKEETGWRREHDWPELRRILARADRSVFSG